MRRTLQASMFIALAAISLLGPLGTTDARAQLFGRGFSFRFTPFPRGEFYQPPATPFYTPPKEPYYRPPVDSYTESPVYTEQTAPYYYTPQFQPPQFQPPMPAYQQYRPMPNAATAPVFE